MVSRIAPITKDKAMTVKHKVTVSVDPPKHLPSSTERRAAMAATLATEQQELKREAAERRDKRAREDAKSEAAKSKAAVSEAGESEQGPKP
jgi:hypothetical protein